MRWGYPHWKPKERPLQNTRLETAATSNFWKDSLASRRCIIPATGFYEWVGENGKKVEFYFSKEGASILYIAGIYKLFAQTAGPPLRHYSMITTVPNKSVAGVHDRMPLVMMKDEIKIWLSSDYMQLASREHIILNSELKKK